MGKRLLAWTAALALALLAGHPAQAQITTGSIQGQALDQQGAALPGVLVVARNSDIGVAREAISGHEGWFTLLGLPPGDYVVRASLSNFLVEPKNVAVALGESVPLDFEMIPLGLTETVRVTYRPSLLNTTKAELSTVVTKEEIRAYPLLNRDFTDLAIFAPGLRTSAGGVFDPIRPPGFANSFTTGGTNGRNLNMAIDGTDNREFLGGFVAQGFPADAIREFEIIQDMPRAEYGRSSGATINVITSSGTNDFSGSLFGTFRNQDTRSSNLSENLAGVEKQEADRSQYGFSVGGPIVKNKLFYFVAAEQQNQESPFALSPVLTQHSGTEPAGFPFTFPAPGTGFTQEFTRDLWSAKIDWNASSRHRLSFRYASDAIDSLFDTGDGFTDPSNNTDTLYQVESAAVSWQWVLSGGMINELRVGWSDFDSRILPSPRGEILELVFDDFALGRNFVSPFELDTERFQVRNDLTWVVNRHTFKTGIDVLSFDSDTAGLDPPGVTFFFFGIDPADTMVSGDSDGNGFDDGIDIITGVLFNTPSKASEEYNAYGAYFQDDWLINERWRLHLGLRVDTEQDLWQAEEGILRSYYECMADPGNNATCGRDPNTVNPPAFEPFDRTFPEDPVMISPRLGFVYRVGGAEKDVVRGSWGLFYDQILGNIPLLNWFHNCSDCFPAPAPIFQSPAQLQAGSVPVLGQPPLPVDFTLNNWVNDPALRSWFDTVMAAGLGPNRLQDGLSGFSGNIVSPEWEPPYVSAFSVGWGHAFRPDLVFDSNFVYRRGFHQMRQEVYAGISGREAPWPAITDSVTGIATYPANLTIMTSDGKTEFFSLQFSLRGGAPKFDYGINLNFSDATGTQDNAGTGAFTADGGVIDLFDGGNIQFSGGSVESEWGDISGNQAVYAFLHGLYRLPLDFRVAAQIGLGTRVSVHGFAGEDVNGDGVASFAEYVGGRGSGLGDDLFFINLRGSKTFDIGKGTALEAFVDIFNLTDEDNYGTSVSHRQLSNGVPNPLYLQPIGNTVTPPRTVQLGLRFSF